MRHFIMLSIFLIHCSCGNSKQNTASTVISQGIFENAFTAKLPLLVCDEKSCPENVGLVLVDQGFAYSRCTGFIMEWNEENILVTNSHCVPDDLKYNKAICKNRIKFLFLKNGEDSPYDCAEVIQISNIFEFETISLDYAFLRLAKPFSGKALKPLLLGSIDFIDTVNIWSILEKSPEQFELKNQKCYFANNTFPYYVNGEDFFSYPVFSLTACDLGPGTSGSPVTSTNNDVLGIHQSGFQPEIIRSELFGLDTLPLMSFASNIRSICGNLDYSCRDKLRKISGDQTFKNFTFKRAEELRKNLVFTNDAVLEDFQKESNFSITKLNDFLIVDIETEVILTFGFRFNDAFMMQKPLIDFTDSKEHTLPDQTICRLNFNFTDYLQEKSVEIRECFKKDILLQKENFKIYLKFTYDNLDFVYTLT